MINVMKNMTQWLLICLALASTHLFAHEEHTKQPSQALTSQLAASVAVSVAVDAQGGIWRATEKAGLIWVDVSRDAGKTFSKPVQVNPTPQRIGADGEARPKIAIGPEGNIYLTWTEALKTPFSGYIWFARSIIQGKTFESPYVVHQDRAEITHRFDALNIAHTGENKGAVTVAWVDKRDLIAAKSAGKPYDGAAIYYAISTNQGASFALEQKLADSSCECCRIAFANKADGTVVAMWRHVFESSERDHMIAEIPRNISQKPVIKRATYGRWKIDGCPHHGAALANGGEGKDWWGYHMAWFDGGNDDAGSKASLFYARMDGEAWVSSPAKKFGNQKKHAGHPTLLSMGDKVWLVWRETEAKHHTIMGMYSDDAGKSWQDANTIATTSDKADYPQLMLKDGQPYLAWNTLKDGFILKAL